MATQVEATLRLKGSDETAAAFQSAAENARRLDRAAADSNRRMTADVDSLGRAFRGLRRTAAIGGATALMADAVKKATDYASALHRIKTSANASDQTMKLVGDRMRSEANRLNLSIGDVVNGYDAWRVASGQSLEEALRSFPLIANAAKALRIPIESVATTTGTLQTNLNLSAEEMTRGFDMITDAAIKLPADQREAFIQNLAGYSEEAKKIGLSGAEGLQQMIATFNAIYAHTKNGEKAWKIFGEVMNKSADPTFLNERWRGGLLKVMQEANKQGVGVVEVLANLVRTGERSEAALRKQWGDEIYDLVIKVKDGTISVDEAQKQLMGTSGALQRALTAALEDPGEKMTRLKNSFDGLLTAVGGLALTLDQKVGKVLDDLFGGEKTGSALDRFARDLTGVADVLAKEGGVQNWLQGQLDLAKKDYERFAGDMQKLFTFEGATAAFTNFQTAYNQFIEDIGFEKWWFDQLEQMKKDAEAFWESIKKLFTWESLGGVVSSISEAFKTGAAKSAEAWGGTKPVAQGYDPWSGKLGAVAGRQGGGPVVSGRPYIIGERGPELFVPGSSGRVVGATSGSPYNDPKARDEMRALTGALHELVQAIQRSSRRQISVRGEVQPTTVGEALGGAPRPSVMPGAATETGFGTRVKSPISLTSAQIKERTGFAMEYFQQRGWSHAASSGIVASLLHESKMKERAVGDAGLAHGIAQWHPARRAAIEKHFGKRVSEMSFEEQLAAVQWELTHGPDVGARRAGRMLQATESRTEAGAIFSKHFERPKRVEYEAQVRGATAEQVAMQFPAAAPAAPAAPIPAAAPAPAAPAGREFGADLYADLMAQRAELEKPIEVTFHYQPGEMLRYRSSLRQGVDRQVREATDSSYADLAGMA